MKVHRLLRTFPAGIHATALAFGLSMLMLSPAHGQQRLLPGARMTPVNATTTMHASLRVGPGPAHGIIAVLARGEHVQIVATSGMWSQVRRTKQPAHLGWLPNDQLQRSASLAAPAVAATPPATPPTAPASSVEPVQSAASASPSSVRAAQSVERVQSPAPSASQRLLLQVLVPRAALHTKPESAAPVVARVEIGAQLEADLRYADWYRIRRPSGGEAWIQNAATATGTALAVAPFPPGKRIAYETAQLNASPNGSGATPALKRVRPQGVPIEPQMPVIDPKQVPPPTAVKAREATAIADRWRVVQSLGLLPYERTDPYNPNVLKGDLPVLQDKLGPGWFFNLTASADTLLEMRRLPGGSAGNTFGDCRQVMLTETGVLGLSLIKGNTAFRPPDYQFRFVPVASANRMLSNKSNGAGLGSACPGRSDEFVGVQELFADKRLRDASVRYDFDSVRVGVQPFTSDFRGLLFVDQALGARLYGTRQGNLWQYNVGLFRRLEKDTNTGLNDLTQRLRADDVLAFNLYRQDWPVNGFTSQGVILHNRNREGSRGQYRNRNGTVERPAAGAAARDYDVSYFGLNGDGHFGRWNLTASVYHALGHNKYDSLSMQRERIRAWFGALELSRDFDWIRLRAHVLYASGDGNPYDRRATGYDAVLERPLIAGAETGYWIHQPLPLIAGGPGLSMRNGVLPSMRTSREHGQSNFINPGLRLAGVGADFDVTPRLRVIGNLSYLTFDDMAVLAALRNQAFTSDVIGTDVSFGMHYRPDLTQNVVMNASVAALSPGQGLKELYGEAADDMLYSILLNLLLTF